MRIYQHIILLFLLVTQSLYSQEIQFKNIEIDAKVSFRGLSVVDDSIAWVSGTKGMIGISRDGGQKWNFQPVKGFEKYDFRTLYAFSANEAVIANAGSPAFILRTQDGGQTWGVVYVNNDSLAFFDGIDFWNDKDGIIYGDPIKGRMLLMKTSDGGRSWHLLPDKSRPLLTEGEASFAASGTGIRCIGENKVIIATGGKASKLFVSENRGNDWQPVKTPILQGKNSTGIFSFSVGKGLLIVGGDYTKDTLKEKHVFYSTRADKIKFRSPKKATGGYRECVEFIADNSAIAVGPAGSDITVDGGRNWAVISAPKGLHVVRKARKGNLVLAAGNETICVMVR